MSNEFSPAECHEARHLLGHYGYEGGYEGGSFITKLIGLLEVADPVNMGRLLSVYPNLKRPVEIMMTRGDVELRRRIEESMNVGGEPK